MPFDFAATIEDHRSALASVATMQTALERAVALVRASLDKGGKVLVCGNGGSASDAQHFAAELTGRFEVERPGLPAIALTTDTSALTSIGNDYGFEHIFERQLQAIGRSGDILLALSTSGNSPNVLRAVEYAREHGIAVIGLLGRDGGRIQQFCDVALTVPVQRTARVQEMHILLLHMLCEGLEA